MSIVMNHQGFCLDESEGFWIDALGEATSDKGLHVDDDTICDTCSGDGSIDEVDDGEVSICSWTTDQGDWDLPFDMTVSPLASDVLSSTTATSTFDSQDVDSNQENIVSACSADTTHCAGTRMMCSDARVAFMPVFVPGPFVWQMQHYPAGQGVAYPPVVNVSQVSGQWHVRAEERPQRQSPKPMPSQERQRVRKEANRKSLQSYNSTGKTPVKAEQNEDQLQTTLIFRNCPCDSGRDTLLQVLDAEGFAALYDFVHFPIEFSSNSVLGYAVVNMVSHSAAERAMQHFEGFDRWPGVEAQPLEIAWNNPLQGLASHVERYRNSTLMHYSVADSHRPLLFRKGVRVAFPKPTTKVRAPRIRAQW